MRGEKVLVGMLLICAVILLSTVIMPIGIANAEDIEYPVDYYGVMQPLRIATTEEPAYSGDHTYTADTLGTTDNPSRGTMLKALIWPPMGKSISSPITKVKVVTYIECIDGDYNSQSLEYRLYAYNLETGELTKKIHDDTWPRTGNTPTYFPLSYGLKTYDDTIICDTKKSALGEKETLILVSICHTFGAKSHHTKYAAHFDTKDYPAYMEVFTSDGKSTKYYIHDSFTTPSVASTGKIVYDSDESGNGDIWVMDADGSNKVRLTDDPERECLPRWSPNGKRIAYCKKDNDGTFDLWIMDSDGTNQRKIYDGDCTWGFYRISWLPDGSKVYFDPGYYAGGGGMPHKICWVDPDGPSTQLEHDLTPLAHPSWLYSEPDISRDGTKITFVHWEGHSWSYNNEIYMGDLSPEGDSVSNIVRLTTNSERDGHPSLSPDNSEIVWGYHSDIWNIWIMNVDGSNPHSLTSDFSKEMAYTPSFSSNGQKIIFAASRNGYYDIWMMTIDGTELTQLTNTDDITECRPDFTSPTPTQEGTCGRITNWKTKCQGVYSPGQKVGAEMEFESLMGGGYNFKGVIIIRSPTEDEYTNSEVEWVPSAPNPQGKFAAGDALYVTIPEGASAGNYDMKLELWNDDTDKLCDVTEWKDDLFTVEGGDTPSNLLENPGFESGELDPWYSTKYYDPYDKCDWISIGVDSEAPYEGGYGAYIDIRCSLDAWGRIIQEPIEITPGESLAVEAKLMYKGDLSDGYAELWLVFLDADKKSLDHVYKKYYESDFDAEGKWLSALLPATTAPSNAKYVRIMVGLADVKSCRLNIDDVIFKSGSTTGNHPPSATKIEPTSDSITIEPGDTQEFKVKAEDVDEEEHNNLKMIEWFLDDLRMETGAADGTSEEVSFTYTFEDVDTFYVKATVYDEQMEEDSVTWDVNVGIAPKIIGFTQVPSNPVGTGEVYYVVTYKNDEQGESFVTLDIQEGNKVVKEPIEYIKGHGQLSDASKAAIKGNMAFIFEKVLDKLVDKGLLDFFNDYLGQDLDSFLEEEDAIGFKIFSQVYASDDYGEDYDIKVIVEDEEGKDSKALTTNVREYYIGIIKEEIEDTNNNPDDGRQIEGIINIPFNYCLPSHDAYIIFVGGEKIIEAYTGKVKSPNAKVMLPKFHLSDGTPRLKHLVKKGKENIKLTTHLFKKPQETKTKIEIVLVDDEGTEYSDDVTLDFQNNYYVNPNWEGRFTEYRRGNEIFKADLTKSQFEEEFKDTNVLRLTKEVEENLNNNKYYDGAYIPDEQRGYANNLMSFEAAELEFVGKNEIEDVKWINDIWEIYGWFGHMKTGVEILVEGADFVTNFNPTKFLLKTLAEEGIGLVISAATDVWKDALAGDGKNIIAIYDDAPSGDLEGNKYGVFTHVHAKQSKYEDGGELKDIINAKKIIWRFTQPFFLCESGKWEFVATGTGAGGIVDADYIPGGANCIEWRSKPEFISPKEKNTISFVGEIKRGVFPDYENQRDLFFVIELPDAYGSTGTGFKLSEFTGVETPIELPIGDNLNDKNEEIETEYTKLYDRAGDNIFRIYVKETEDKWYVKNDGVETDYYDFKPVTVHPRLFAVNLEKSLGKPYLFGFTLTVDKDLKEDKYDDYVIKYGVFPGKVSKTSEDDVIYAENYKYMISYDINSANGLNLRDSFSLKVTDEVSVSGQVIDKESGEPISNAVVGVYHGIGQILDPYTYTDSDGKFNLNYLGEEPFTLAAWKEGYIREEKEVNQGACTFYLISQDSGETFTNTIGMEFVLIPAGEFDMGSPLDEEGRYENEGPVHHVNIGKAFYMGRYEVTQKQWREVMGDNPSYFTGDDLPVEKVSWDDAQEFIKKLNEKEGTDKYRLPSEAEWEYACRAGTTSRYSFGDDESKLGDYAWYYDNSGIKTHPVGQKNPNSWRLYDMYGNVWEWVQDRRGRDNYNGAPTDGSAWANYGADRVIRGGGWNCRAGFCRSAARYRLDFRNRDCALGFRLLKEQ